MRWLAAALLVAGCSGQPAIRPGGVVSDNPCIDAILAEVAAPGQVAAVSRWSHDPQSASAPLAWARRLPAVGSSAEELISAKPRLVFTGNLAGQGTNAALKRAGIPTVALGVPASIAESEAQIGTIAKTLGRGEAGAQLIDRIEAALIAPAARGRVSALIWQNGGFVAGKGTLQDEMLTRMGFRNASADYGLKQWEVLPLETLIRQPPDIIFMPMTARGDDARALDLRQRLLRRLGGRVRIVNFDDKLLFCGGPTIIAGAQAMRRAL